MAAAQAATAAAVTAAPRLRCHPRRPTPFAGIAHSTSSSSVAPAWRQPHAAQRQAAVRASSGEGDDLLAGAAAAAPQQGATTRAPRDDDILPDSLTGALEDASNATVDALERGVDRCIVEILLPELWDPLSGPVYAEEGDQQRFWKLTRRFLDNLAALQPDKRIRAVYPDMGVSAMLKNQWTDASFGFASLNDRTPVEATDDIIVLAAPDPMGADDVIRITQSLVEGQCLVMFNPRLASGDVGVGLAIRRMRDNFLSRFTTTYSLRPMADVGSVFRRYPGMWQVFVLDEKLPGRYKLVAERPSRPGGEVLDYILMDALGTPAGGEGQAGGAVGFVNQVGLTLSSLQRFMRSLSN